MTVASALQPAADAPDSALKSLAAVAQANVQAVSMIRHAADSNHYAVSTWPGAEDWLTSNTASVRAFAGDLQAWCDRMER